MDEQERLQILEMIEKGVITAEEGIRLLNSLQGEPDEAAQPVLPAESVAGAEPLPPVSPAHEAIPEEPPLEPGPSSRKQFDASISKWRRWWWIPLAVGIGITVISGLLMFLAYQKSGFGFWFACLWFPLLFGVLVISLAAASRTARWLHVRVHQAPGERPQTIAISLPIPLRLTAWLLRLFKSRIPGMDNANLSEAILALGKVTPEEPFYVKVDEDDSGEKVEVYIG